MCLVIRTTNNTLENAIVKYKEAISKAIEAKSQIKIKTENNK
ncbi:hypothetical protein BBU29805_J33 (plasmid) [Borreliella burgdorferi 29805]|nr:hypothetical protein BBU29805_J33 [Borreliella burgdorferi 29805]